MNSDNRRRATRHAILFPMKYDIESPETSASPSLAISRNISQSGMLMAAASKLVVGATVNITFHPTTAYPHPRKIEGCIVRVDPNTVDPDGLWPYMVAVAFDSDEAELEPVLVEIAETQRGWAEETTANARVDDATR